MRPAAGRGSVFTSALQGLTCTGRDPRNSIGGENPSILLSILCTAPKKNKEVSAGLKALIALVAVQTAILLALFVRVIHLEGEITQTQRAEPVPSYIQPSSSQTERVAVIPNVDDDRLRQIIREELAVALEDVRVASGTIDTNQAAPPQSGPAYERRRDAVAQSVDYYVSVGQINEQEMSRLQQQIAELNPEDRQTMIAAIVRAMNSGRLDGQL